MVRLIVVVIFVLLVLGATAIILLGPLSLAETRNMIVGRPTSPPKSVKTLKRTWRNGPATTPPEIEIVPCRTPFPAPVKPLMAATDGQGRQGIVRPARNSSEPAAVSRQAAIHHASAPTRLGAQPATAVAGAAEITMIDDSLSRPIRLDPEARARADLTCLHDNAKARQAFYDDLSRTVQQVRGGLPDLKEAVGCSAFPD